MNIKNVQICEGNYLSGKIIEKEEFHLHDIGKPTLKLQPPIPTREFNLEELKKLHLEIGEIIKMMEK